MEIQYKNSSQDGVHPIFTLIPNKFNYGMNTLSNTSLLCSLIFVFLLISLPRVLLLISINGCAKKYFFHSFVLFQTRESDERYYETILHFFKILTKNTIVIHCVIRRTRNLFSFFLLLYFLFDLSYKKYFTDLLTFIIHLRRTRENNI